MALVDPTVHVTSIFVAFVLVIRFFRTYHDQKYRIYNLCSEQQYDKMKFDGHVGEFPFDDHNCPSFQLIVQYCEVSLISVRCSIRCECVIEIRVCGAAWSQDASKWLQADPAHVIATHCKAGKVLFDLLRCTLLPVVEHSRRHAYL